jgi:hypothetical protein
MPAIQEQGDERCLRSPPLDPAMSAPPMGGGAVHHAEPSSHSEAGPDIVERIREHLLGNSRSSALAVLG